MQLASRFISLLRFKHSLSIGRNVKVVNRHPNMSRFLRHAARVQSLHLAEFDEEYFPLLIVLIETFPKLLALD